MNNVNPGLTFNRLDDYLYQKAASNTAADHSDAYILSEFEKRFGKRIKLGEDRDTFVLGSGPSKQVISQGVWFKKLMYLFSICNVQAK